MNQENEIRTTVLQLLHTIAPDMDPETLKDDDYFRQELGMDSFDTLQFIVALSEKFGISIPEQDYGKITTLSSLVAYIREKLPAG